MFKKIVFVLLGLIIIVALSSVLIAVVYKKDINNFIVESANKKLNARFSFKDVSIGILKSFPRLGVDIEDVKIVGIREFEKDTLAIISKASIQISITEYLFNHSVDIEKIKVQQADLHLKVLKNGMSNWDIVKTDSLAAKDTTKKAMHIALKKYEFDNANIIYDDQLRNVYAHLVDLTHSGSGDFTKDIFSLDTKTNAEKLSFSYLGKPYLSEVKAKLEAPLQMNFTKMEFAFKNNELLLNALPIRFDAWFAMPDSNIDMDIKFDAAKSPLKDFLSLVPLLYQNSFKDLTASGKFGLSGYVKGRMNNIQMPGFGLGLTIENGAFKYATIPAGIKDLNLNLKIDNPDGNVDHTVIDMRQMQMRLNNQYIQANLLVKTPKSNPYINAKAKGDMDLGALLNIIPQKELTLSGNIKMDLLVNGNVNDFKVGKGFAKGNFDVSQMNYTNASIKKEVQIATASFTVTPQKLLVNAFSSTMGKSDFNIKGSLENYILYFIKNEPIAGNISLNSNLIDLNELMSLSGSNKTDTNSGFELPKNVNLSATANIVQIKYKDLLMSNASGGVAFADQKVNFKKLAFNLLDASFIMNGSFAKQEKQDPETNLTLTIQNLNINKAYKSFDIIQKYASIAEALQGNMNLNVNLSTLLTKSLSPNLGTLNSEGDVYINDANLSGSGVLNKMADLVKWSQLKSLSVKTAHLSYSIQNGRFIVKPFDVLTNLTKLNISGSSGLDKSINYVIGIDMPKQVVDLGAASDLSKELAKISPTLSLDNIAKSLKLQVLVTGNMQNPNLKLGIKGTGSGADASTPVTSQIKEVVNNAVKQQVNTKLDQAQQQADAIIQEAKIAADKLKQEAYDRADKMVADAQNPFAKMGVKLVADKIKKEADNKSNQIIEEANQRAKDIINKAKNQQ